MVESYLRSLSALLEAVDPPDTIACKHFFGGAAAYAQGQIFMTLTPVGLALKLPEASRDRLIALGAQPLRYFPTGPIKKDYVVVPEILAHDRAALAPWIKESIGFAQSLAKR
jgi:TfoX/Sxy family transcriptional regulator of competence genes